jgi:hypothetical protein
MGIEVMIVQEVEARLLREPDHQRTDPRGSDSSGMDPAGIASRRTTSVTLVRPSNDYATAMAKHQRVMCLHTIRLRRFGKPAGR